MIPPSSSRRALTLRAAVKMLFRAQIERPLLLLFTAVLSVALSAYAASRLTLRTSLAELLPEKKRSVVVAREVASRLSASSVLSVVAESNDTKALERFVDALGPELRRIDPSLVGSVDDGVRSASAFFDQHALLYAPLDDVKELHDRVVERYDYEVARESGNLLDDSDAPPPLDAARFRARAEEQRDAAFARYPDGYYLDQSGHLIVVLVHTAVESGDIARSEDLRARVLAAIDHAHPASFDPAMRVDLAGDFIEALEENAQVKADLSSVGATGVLLVLGVVFLFFLRLRSLAAMALTVGIGVAWTFGISALTVGHLNASTGFLLSIVAGNGINFGIVFMARHLEARRSSSMAESLLTAHRETYGATLGAALAAAASYGSLLFTECRAFREFGLIGGLGMILCWIATYLYLPAILAAFEFYAPEKESSGLAAKLRGAYGRPFAWLATRRPRPVLALSGVIAAISIVLGVRWIANDPMEYDLSKVRTEMAESRARQLEPRAAAIVGRGQWDGVAILATSPAEIAELKTALEAKRDRAPADRKPFDKIITLADFTPRYVDQKLAMLAGVKNRLERAHRRGAVSDDDYAALAPYLSPDALRPIGIDDLPSSVAAAFTEKDGTRGRVAYITPAEGRTLGDARYLREWADAFRSTALSGGTVVEGSGRSVIFADLIQTVIDDTPRALGLSLVATALVVVTMFRRRKGSGLALATLGLGVLAMMPVLALARTKLNFLNFVALPITIGVGADYAINMVHRLNRARASEVRGGVIETGGAVVLCSLTTTLGYVALLFSKNQAIRSFGFVAAAGEIACILAAVLVLPAWLALRGQSLTAWRRIETRSSPQKSPTISIVPTSLLP